MNMKKRNTVFINTILFSWGLAFLLACQSKNQTYICPPCDLACDQLTFDKAGKCPHCKMELIPNDGIPIEEAPLINIVDIREGSGSFWIEGGENKKEKPIRVYYHKPQNYRPNSKILMVIPGAGRNGDRYRDAWIEESEKYGILILSPRYPEQDYDFGAYHLCNLLYDLNLEGSVEYIEGTNHAKMTEENFTYKVNSNADEWLFNDFDRIFDLVVEELNATTTQYDLFGHSAGGQILHRLAIFYESPRINYIIASNSGFYTLPDMKASLPFGIQDTPLEKQDLKTAFKKKLILFNGELDNAQETGGTLLRSTSADRQGLHRLERGNYFFKKSQNLAKELANDFNWEIQVVPDVGHDHRKMWNAAAEYLYGKEEE